MRDNFQSTLCALTALVPSKSQPKAQRWTESQLQDHLTERRISLLLSFFALVRLSVKRHVMGRTYALLSLLNPMLSPIYLTKYPWKVRRRRKSEHLRVISNSSITNRKKISEGAFQFLRRKKGWATGKNCL